MTRRPPSPVRAAVSAAILAVALAATASLVVAPAAHSATAPGEETTRWSVAPADAEGPDGRISLRHVAEPGAVVVDAIAVTNQGSSPASFSVVAGDGMLGDTGAFDIAAGDPVGSGSWITIDGLSDDVVDLAAGETRVLPVTIAVPDDATPGDHPAGVVVALSRTDDSVIVTNRIGVRLHLQVAGELDPRLEVTSVDAAFAPSWVPFGSGALSVRLEVANTGNVRLGAVGGAGAFGAAAVSDADEPVELLPGDTATLEVELQAWPLGFLFGEARVDAVAVGEDRVASTEAVAQSFVAPAVSWTGLAILVVLVGGVVVFLIVRRRRRPATPADDPAAAS